MAMYPPYVTGGGITYGGVVATITYIEEIVCIDVSVKGWTVGRLVFTLGHLTSSEGLALVIVLLNSAAGIGIY